MDRTIIRLPKEVAQEKSAWQSFLKERCPGAVLGLNVLLGSGPKFVSDERVRAWIDCQERHDDKRTQRAVEQCEYVVVAPPGLVFGAGSDPGLVDPPIQCVEKRMQINKRLQEQEAHELSQPA